MQWCTWLVAFIVVGIAGCGGMDPSPDGSGTGMVTVELPDAPEALVAYRDGDGAWTLADASSGEVSFSAASGRYGVAVVCDLADTKSVRVYQLTTDDTTTLVHDGECRTSSVTVSGALTGDDGGATVSFGAQHAYFANVQTGAYMLKAPAGTHDLVASHLLGGLLSDRATILRGFDATSDATQDLDLVGGMSFALERHTLSVPGATANVLAHTFLATEGGTLTFALSTTPAPLQVVGVPEAMLAPGDVHDVALFDAASETENPTFYRSAWLARHTLADATYSFAHSFVDPPTVDVPSQGTSVGLSATWPALPAGDVYDLVVRTTGAWRVETSAAYVGDASFVFALPDLSALPGWDPALDGQATVWDLAACSGSDLAELLRAFPSQEGTIDCGGWTGNL